MTTEELREYMMKYIPLEIEMLSGKPGSLAEQRFDRGLRSTAVARAREHRIAQYSRQVLLPVLERAVKAAPAAVFRRIRLGGGEKRRAAGVLGISVPVQRQKIAERGLFAEMLVARDLLAQKYAPHNTSRPSFCPYRCSR